MSCCSAFLLFCFLGCPAFKEPLMIPPRKKTLAKLGVFGIGLAAYWPQFPWLKTKLEKYQSQVEQRLRKMGAEVASAGLVDTAEAAVKAGDQFVREGVDLLICYVGTYSTSSQVLPAVQRVNKPVLILNLQPLAALDYPNTDTGHWLEQCCSCCVPEISCS